MRVLVCGGRDFSDTAMVFAALDRIHAKRGISCIIDGAARGADQLGSNWATKHGIANIRCPADWNRYGKSAGFMRNRTMLVSERPDLVVAFPGGRGTAHMVQLATKSGFTVWQPLRAR